jgi:hypothetical protein
MFARNRRAHPRKTLQAKAWIAGSTPDSWMEIRIVDISKGGFAFISQEAMTMTMVHSFRFQFPDSSRMMLLDASVTNCIERPYPDGFRIGMEFSRIDVTDLATIEWMLEHKS